MFIQLPDPICLDTPGTTLVEFNDFPNISTEHLEANHRRMIGILKHQCVALGVCIHVIARDHQDGTFDWRQRAKPGCLLLSPRPITRCAFSRYSPEAILVVN